MNAPRLESRMSEWLERIWLARYLERKLSAEEAAWFEAYALDKEPLLEAIEADTTLRDALAAVGSPALEGGTTQQAKAQIAGRGGLIGRWNWMSSAAALLIG